MYPYKVEDVTGVDLPTSLYRTAIEHEQLRKALRLVEGREHLNAVELGCGYGRMLPPLIENFKTAVGFERNETLRTIASKLFGPGRIWPLDSFTGSGPFHFVMTWTVLQHMTTPECESWLEKIRSTKELQYILLMEETDTRLSVERENPDEHQTIGRLPSWYIERLRGFSPILARPRYLEPSYPRKDVGYLMLFKKN